MPAQRLRPLSPIGCGEAMLNQDIVREATRLTRAGRLVEATVLLQRMLRGEMRDANLRTTSRIAAAVQKHQVIDAEANTIEVKSPSSAPTTSPEPPMLRRLLNRTKSRSGLGLQDVIRRTPPST